jgi:hypothetical protein
MLADISLVGTVTRLWVGRSGVRIPAWTKDLFCQNVRTVTQARSASYSMGIFVVVVGGWVGVKLAGPELTSHSPFICYRVSELVVYPTSILRLQGV